MPPTLKVVAQTVGINWAAPLAKWISPTESESGDRPTEDKGTSPLQEKQADPARGENRQVTGKHKKQRKTTKQTEIPDNLGT